MEITDLTPAERRVWQAFSVGRGVDFTDSGDGGAEAGASWGPERTVRASVIRALLIGGPVGDGEIAGLKLTGARITGRLDLGYGSIDHPVRLRSCHFEQVPHLYGAQIRALVLSDSVLPGLSAATLRVDGVLRITGCRVTGPVRLQGAKVTGAFFLDGAHLGSPAGGSAPTPSTGAADGPAGEPVLQLNHAEIGTDVWAVGLVAHGQVRLDGATVGGRVNLEGAELRAAGGTALQAESLTVGTDLNALRLCAHGRVVLSGARIPRHLNLAHARLSRPDGEALSADSCVVGELWLRDAAPITGTVDLRRSQVEFLHALPDVWPERVRIDGLSYRTLAPHLPAEERLPLLEREADGYLPHSYEQLTSAYRVAGDDAAARTVQLTKLRRHRGTLIWYARWWGHLQDAAVGYGFRPVRAAGWLLLLLLIGTTAFTFCEPRPLKPGEAPDFHPLVYTLDLLLPFVGFGQENAFTPRGAWQWLAYLLIVTGWILATTVLAGITRALSRQ
ncbi:membrane-associated oxidoreductase [Streptomyces sp. PBH53]|uniref:membrane-associated oxidoreductase n=1 Tax=Streptomyces sp. PBH53 TaxID=1577075 RepID=UPI000655CC8D|nr:membrane-associated oxidoreductase [Streptomyces sp. PBH53]AKN74512.1 membrane-associated oxidoreductase [Streptomyces sp. PBH53]